MRFAILIASFTLPALACECRTVDVCGLIESPTLFIGKVVSGGIDSLNQDPWYSSVDHVRFEVLENFRGIAKGTQFLDVALMPTAGMCSPNPYFLGRTYLAAPGKVNGSLLDGGCFQGRDIDIYADDVRQVREYFSGKMAVNIQGRIAVAWDSSLVNFLLLMGETKPLSGVQVSTSREGKVYETFTDALGRYFLKVPFPGKYDLRTSLAAYTSMPERTVDVSSKGCAVRDIGMRIDNTISGSVLDSDGKPIKDARVGLIDLDHPNPPDRHPWLFEAYAEKSDKTFQFKDVPLGRYRLVFNPDGPQAATPHESTSYPQTIEIETGGTHLAAMNLIAGPPVQFRKVSVKVQFADGTPMKTAAVHCTAEPPWRPDRVIPREGLTEFQAPVNRKLRIEVEDGYRRALKGTYVSTHGPGPSPVNQTFVIRR